MGKPRKVLEKTKIPQNIGKVIYIVLYSAAFKRMTL